MSVCDSHPSGSTMRRTGAWCTIVALALMLGGVAVAQAATGLGVIMKFRARFTTMHTGTASGLALETAGRLPRAGVSEAPAVRQSVVLPNGTTLRLARLPQCRASDAAIAAHGAEGACPPTSRVGSGGADGVLDGAPVHFDVGIYAVRGHLVFAAERGGLPLKQSFNGLASGRRLVLTVPTLGGRIAPTGFTARMPARPGGRVWLLTPRRCPAAGHWTAVGRFLGVSAAAPGANPVTPVQIRADRLACT